jgi:hypothetical protein
LKFRLREGEVQDAECGWVIAPSVIHSCTRLSTTSLPHRPWLLFKLRILCQILNFYQTNTRLAARHPPTSQVGRQPALGIRALKLYTKKFLQKSDQRLSKKRERTVSLEPSTPKPEDVSWLLINHELLCLSILAGRRYRAISGQQLRA